MSTDEKTNVFIAVALSVAAVIIIFLWGKHGGSLTVPSAASVTPPTIDGTTVPTPTYVNYNIPAYNPPAIQVLGQQNAPPLQPTNSVSNGGGCCNQCGVGNNDGGVETQNINNWNLYS